LTTIFKKLLKAFSKQEQSAKRLVGAIKKTVTFIQELNFPLLFFDLLEKKTFGTKYSIIDLFSWCRKSPIKKTLVVALSVLSIVVHANQG